MDAKEALENCLIAAAPELLDGLEYIANGYPNREIDIYAVKAAIAKAKGE